MKKIKLLFLFTCLIATGISDCYAFSIGKPVADSNSNKSLQFLKVSDFIKMSEKEYSDLTGTKMNIWKKTSFSLLKLKMKHELKTNPNLTLNNFYNTKSKHRLATVWVVLLTVVGVLLLLALLLGLTLSAGG